MKPINEKAQPAVNTPSTAIGQKAHVRKHLASRLAALSGVLVLGVLYLLLPDTLTLGPSWILLVIEAVLMIPLLILSMTTSFSFPHGTIRTIGLILLGVTTLAMAIGIGLLLATIPDAKGFTLLRSAGILWIFNVLVFALWYFEIDGGGPLKRHMRGPQATDFLFPQYTPDLKSGWMPHFIDYVFLAFTSSTALSPADTQPLSHRAKVLMMIQALFSLILIAVLAARAVNILS